MLIPHLVSLLFTLALVPFTLSYSVSYDGDQVLRVPAGSTTSEAAHLRTVIDALGLQTWSHTIDVNKIVDVVVPAGQLGAFKAVLGGGRNYTVMHEDLGAAIRAESNKHSGNKDGDFSTTKDDGPSPSSGVPPGWGWFTSYHSYAEHTAHWEFLQQLYHRNSAMFTIGNSYEGRPIRGIHLFGAGGKGSRPAIVFTAAVHSREWITTAVVEFMFYELLTTYAKDARTRKLLDAYDFYMIPVLNPDGFIYSQTTDRLWRTNRMPSHTNGSCIGTDVNRNWPYKWDVPNGASIDPCSEAYRGDSAGSTPEVQAIADFLQSLSHPTSTGVKMYIDWHSYSQLFMTPYAYTCLPVSPVSVDAELQSLASGFAAAVKNISGTDYDYGPICSTIYLASGSSVDYGYDVAGIRYSFAVELRDEGEFGFLLPQEQIYPTGWETWVGVRYLLENIK